MKLLLLSAILLLSSLQTLSQVSGYQDFEIVESIPVETNLDNPQIRNTHEVWMEMISGAKRSIDLEQFYVSNKAGEPLEDILQAIIAAGARGVHVRLIVDARMYRTYPDMVDSVGRQTNIQKRIIDFGKLANGVQHAKYFIVDSEEIFLGSQNFDWRALKHIHELGLRIHHPPAVKIYQDIFDLDWNLAEKNDPAEVKSFLKTNSYPSRFVMKESHADSIIFTTTMSPKGLIPDSALWDETNIVQLIDRAKNDVMCQFLTYSPINRDKSYYAVLNDALIRAAARGVNIKLIVSDWSKEASTVEYLKKLSKVPKVSIKFSIIPEWSGGYISFARVEHCKYIVVDNSDFWLGTSNAEKGYFYNLRNIGVVATNDKLTAILRSIFLKDWDGPYVELLDAEKQYSPKAHGEQ